MGGSILSDKRVALFIGNFGSGKTELAINYALRSAEDGRKTTLVDLDVVTPYFRSRDVREMMGERDVPVIAPPAEFDSADLPILPTELDRAFADRSRYVVVDVGGDEGARVLGGLRRYFPPGESETYLVANSRRPFTSDAAAISRMRFWLERLARLPVTAILSNANLGRQTTPETVRAGYQIISAAAGEAGLPVAAVVVPDFLAGQVRAGDYPVPVWFIRRFMKPPWEA